MKKTDPQTEGQLLTGVIKTLDDHFKGYLALHLTGFANYLRAELEDDQDLQHFETDAALLLSNLCEYLKLTDEHRAQVLGPQPAAYVAVLEGNYPTVEAFCEASLL